MQPDFLTFYLFCAHIETGVRLKNDRERFCSLFLSFFLTYLLSFLIFYDSEDSLLIVPQARDKEMRRMQLDFLIFYLFCARIETERQTTE